MPGLPSCREWKKLGKLLFAVTVANPGKPNRNRMFVREDGGMWTGGGSFPAPPGSKKAGAGE